MVRPTIEDIILSWDRRGVASLRSHLPPDYCTRAARFIHGHGGTTLIVTGFYEIKPGVIETDGPPGALALGRALQAMGRRVVYMSDRYAVPFLGDAEPGGEIVEFPITDCEASEAFADDVLRRYAPTLAIAIERCGVTASGRYLNMSSTDISAFTAMTDYLFPEHLASVGVGDGGNEIGMGKLANVIAEMPNLITEPPVTKTTHLVIASVSNWGAYGLVAALSVLEGRNLLPSADQQSQVIMHMVDMGAVDGEYLEPMYRVDGFTLGKNAEILDRLRATVRNNEIED